MAAYVNCKWRALLDSAARSSTITSMPTRTVRVALITAEVILLLAIVWTIVVATRPPGVSSGGGPILVVGHLIGGGQGAREPQDVRFEQNGKVVSSTRTVPPAQSFRLWLFPGAYAVIVNIHGCPPTPVTVQGSSVDLLIHCNLAG